MGQRLKRQVILSLGSNLGDRNQNLEQCISYIEEHIGPISKRSTQFKNPPVGFTSTEEFSNMCVLVNTKQTSKEILNHIQKIENGMGRIKSGREYEDRIIDIDIILLNDEVIQSNTLTIPHKHYRSRDFVLRPMKELGNFIDPQVFLYTDQFIR